MQPSEFWELSLTEFWWEFDSHVVQNKAVEKPPKGFGKFSGPQWEAARKIHREKVNGRAN